MNKKSIARTLNDIRRPLKKYVEERYKDGKTNQLALFAACGMAVAFDVSRELVNGDLDGTSFGEIEDYAIDRMTDAIKNLVDGIDIDLARECG